MKYKSYIFLLLAIIAISFVNVAAQPIQKLLEEGFFGEIIFDGQNIVLDEQPIMINDKIYLPLRATAEHLGKNVIWIENGNKVVITSQDYQDNELYSYQENNIYGYKNSRGDIIIPPQYDIACSFNDGIALVGTGSMHFEKYFYIDKQGNKLFNQEFEDARSFSEGFAVVMTEGFGGPPLPLDSNSIRKYSYINRDGKLATDRCFELAYDFEHGLACVCINGKWGMIDLTFDNVIDFKYNTISELKESEEYLHIAEQM